MEKEQPAVSPDFFAAVNYAGAQLPPHGNIEDTDFSNEGLGRRYSALRSELAELKSRVEQLERNRHEQ